MSKARGLAALGNAYSDGVVLPLISAPVSG